MLKKIVEKNMFYILALIILMLISTAIMKSDTYYSIVEFDKEVIIFINTIVNNSLSTFFKIITEFGNIYIPFGILIGLLITFKNKFIVLFQFLSYCFAGFISLLSKFIILRDRPTIALIDIPKTYSFPSGHSLTSFVFYMTLCYLLTKNKSKKIKIISYIITTILVLLVGISRIYLGVHYFSDVIGGFIYGIVIFLLVRSIIETSFKGKLS